MYLQRSIFSPFFLSFGGGSQPGRNGSNQTARAEERESREGGYSEFLGKLALREERWGSESWDARVSAR